MPPVMTSTWEALLGILIFGGVLFLAVILGNLYMGWPAIGEKATNIITDFLVWLWIVVLFLVALYVAIWFAKRMWEAA